MKITILFIIFTSTLSAQWLGGAAYQVKSSIPANGAAFYAIKKLHYQFPDIGFNFKGKLNYFFSEQDVFIDRADESRSYHETSLDLMIEVNFFHGVIKPFTSIGAGGGYLYSDNFKKAYFSLSAQGGLKFFTSIQPFLELHFKHTFADYSGSGNTSIKRFQAGGALGVLFSL
jgi:hypothetical protein